MRNTYYDKEISYKDVIVDTTIAKQDAGPAIVHSHPSYEIYLSRMPRMRMMVNGRIYEVTAGDLFLFSSFDIHQPLDMEQGAYERNILFFSPEFVQEFCTQQTDLLACFYHDPGSCAVLHLTADQLTVFDTLFSELLMLQSTEESEYGSDVRKHICFLNLLLYINKWSGCAGSVKKITVKQDKREMGDIVRYITAHLTEDLSLDALSKRFHINKHYLITRIVQATGYTPHRYIVLCRIAFSRVRLWQGASVTDAAFDSGFEDVSHFIRVYKQITGKTPGEYAAERYE